jgi:ankyrin repeat protein
MRKENNIQECNSVISVLKPKSKEEITKSALAISDPDELLNVAINKLNNVDIVKTALQRGADPNKASYADVKNVEILKELLFNPKIDIYPNILVLKAVKLNLENEIIKLIEQKKLDPIAKNSRIAVWSLGFCLKNVVTYLLKTKQINFLKDKDFLAEALSIAIARNNNELVEMVLKDKKIDPSADNNRPIKIAAQFGNEEVVKMLLKDKRVDPSDKDLINNRYNYALSLAVANEHKNVVDLLMKDKRVIAKINKQ